MPPGLLPLAHPSSYFEPQSRTLAGNSRLICKTDNWKDVFGVVFGRMESVRETFQRLYPVRLDTAHGRLDDELLLSVEFKRLEKAIQKRRR
jgi:hypothetical protein